MMKTLTLIVSILLLSVSWYDRQQVEAIPIALENDEIPNNNTRIVRGAIVTREFVDKAGRPRGVSELYFQIAGDDYFIKFCESNVSRDELERYLDRLAAFNPAGDNAISLEIEIRRGLWICHDGLELLQSRVGRYVVIHGIVESQTGD